MIALRRTKRVLVVGAGFAGAVYARTLAEAGHSVDVIDCREYIGGNAYDRVDENGVRVHVYGPHLFHTRIARTAEWLRKFGEFVPYTHRVRARLSNGEAVPIPINRNTINAVFGVTLRQPTDVAAFLKTLAHPIANPANAAQYLYAKIGDRLTETFFRPYTQKMWGLRLEDMAASVVQRIPLREDDDDSYFRSDEIQMLPKNGYTSVFQRIYDHSNISVFLNQPFEKDWISDYDYCFNSMAIDEYYDYCFGELPYRSIIFHHRTERGVTDLPWSVTNFTDDSPFTRETAWHALPFHREIDTGRVTITREEPCDYKENAGERYYPVKTSDGRYAKIYEDYRRRSEEDLGKMAFIGRCGTYQYLDMDQVINQSLTRVEAWMAR